MKVHFKRALSLFLAVALCVSVTVVPVAALTLGELQSKLMTEVALPNGQCTEGQLETYRDRYNLLRRTTLSVYGELGDAVITFDTYNSVERLIDSKSNQYIASLSGGYPYVPVSGDVPSEPGTAPAEVPATPSRSRNKFVDSRLVKWSTLAISSYNALAELVVNLGKEGIDATLAKNNVSKGDGKTTVPMWYVANKAKTAVYCNSSGVPFVASAEPAAKDIDFNIVVDNSKTNSDNTVVVDNSKILDTVNNVMTVINEYGDKISYNIDSLYYDGTTNTYTANTYQFNDNSNTYNYYTWNITYNITNTYINYIGSNVGFEHDEYKYYYQLPDGRSSEDLTADEVGAMSFQFADVKNYARSATDTSLRALYHFDGNTEDSGYFSTQTKFSWVTNASIQYMDSASFGGALYLDERTHDFDIDLPSNLGSGDFSIQWRHYQASEKDSLSNINNRIAIGVVTVLRLDEQNYYMGASGITVASTIPVGSWHELALIRHSGTLYFYVNGLRVSSVVDMTGYQGKLMFCFGTTSRAYTMLDELRVVSFAVAKSGASYQCSTVPYDTNLVLVLPDGAFPIADEYWEFNTSGNMLTSGDFTEGVLPVGWRTYSHASVALTTFFESDFMKLTADYPNTWDPRYVKAPDIQDQMYMSMGVNYLFSTRPEAGTYTISVLDVDGNLSSFTFDLTTASKQYKSKEFSWGYIVYGQESSYFGLAIVPRDNVPFSFRYVEMVPGNTPNTGHKKISCIYSSEDIKPNTAAVQSSIPVTGYTVGGVRPTFPERGNVWFPVSGNRINGCYIYDGSMWRIAGCRYYTGTRWIPIYAFDIYTLADCWDVADAVDVTPPITTEYDFWNWWKKEWTDFRAWLRGLSPGGAGGNGGDGTVTVPDGTLPNLPGENEEDEGFSIFDIVKKAVDALWKLVSGLFKTIFGGVTSFFFNVVPRITDFFDAFDGDNGVFGFAKYGGVDIWD